MASGQQKVKKQGAPPPAPPGGRLQRITNLEPLAVQACYSGSVLARRCGVSLRQLQRHIQSEYGDTLGGWLNVLRLKHGHRRLLEGCSVKETAFSLGYKQVSHFSRSFKNFHGFNPSTVPITLELEAKNSVADAQGERSQGAAGKGPTGKPMGLPSRPATRSGQAPRTSR